MCSTALEQIKHEADGTDSPDTCNLTCWAEKQTFPEVKKLLCAAKNNGCYILHESTSVKLEAHDITRTAKIPKTKFKPSCENMNQEKPKILFVMVSYNLLL
jgi:hypothetical protein